MKQLIGLIVLSVMLGSNAFADQLRQKGDRCLKSIFTNPMYPDVERTPASADGGDDGVFSQIAMKFSGLEKHLKYYLSVEKNFVQRPMKDEELRKLRYGICRCKSQGILPDSIASAQKKIVNNPEIKVEDMAGARELQDADLDCGMAVGANW